MITRRKILEKPKFSEDNKFFVFELLSNDYVNDTLRQKLEGSKQEFYPKNFLSKIPHLEYKKVDENGMLKHKVFLSKCGSIDREEQVKLGYGKKIEFTLEDSMKLRFRKGFCIVQEQNVLDFLWDSPQHVLFEGNRELNIKPMFRLKEDEVVSTSNAVLLHLTNKALTIVSDILDIENSYKNVDKEKLQSIFHKLYGGHHKVGENYSDLYTQIGSILSTAVDENDDVFKVIFSLGKDKNKKEITNNDEADEVLVDFNEADDVLVDFNEEANVLIGKAIEAEKLSFNEKPNNVSIKIGKSFKSIYSTTAQMDSIEDLKNLFVEYLKTDEGQKILTTIKTLIQ